MCDSLYSEVEHVYAMIGDTWQHLAKHVSEERNTETNRELSRQVETVSVEFALTLVVS